MHSHLLVLTSALLLAVSSATPVAKPFPPANYTDAGLRISTRELRHRHHVRRMKAKRGEPTTGDDLDTGDPSPNKLDRVEAAFSDALELCSYVGDQTGDFVNTGPYPNFFNTADSASVLNVYKTILAGDPHDPNAVLGNSMLDDIHVQVDDPNGGCTPGTLAASYFENEPNPFIVLCPPLFNKKGVTPINGVPEGDENAYYIGCTGQEQGGEVGPNLSYHVNSIGMTLLHEYTHYDAMIESVAGCQVIDQMNPSGYGPVNVYNNLDKGLAKCNADSYAYYASNVLWNVLCETTLAAPVAGTDDADPDCNNAPCKAP